MKIGRNPYYQSPELFVIGDVHSESAKLKSLLSKILPLKSDTHLVFVGDLIDQGSDPIGVLEIVRDLKKEYPGQVFVIKGNHEIMFQEYFLGRSHGPVKYFDYENQNGRETLLKLREHFKTSDKDQILRGLMDQGLWSIFEDLIPYYESEKVLVTHAPLDAIMLSLYSNRDQIEDNALWEKNLEGVLENMGDEIYWRFSSSKSLPFSFKKQLISGHQFSHKRPVMFKERVFLDCGVGYKPEASLFAVKMPGKKIISS